MPAPTTPTAPAATAAAAAAAASPAADVAARFQQVDLEALAAIDMDTDNSAESLEDNLAALHAEVDGHLDDVLNHEADVDSEAARIEAEVDQEEEQA